MDESGCFQLYEVEIVTGEYIINNLDRFLELKELEKIEGCFNCDTYYSMMYCSDMNVNINIATISQYSTEYEKIQNIRI